MALATRSGVAARPSRAGSSPRRTIISRTRSSKLALVTVAGSFVCSRLAGFMGFFVVCETLSPLRGWFPLSRIYPRLAPWALIFRRLAAGLLRNAQAAVPPLAPSSLRFGGAAVLEGVHHGFLDPHSFKMSLFKATVQYFVDLY